mgnify:FL=1
MSYERIMGLNIINDGDYQKYREGMIPILHSYGGSFGFDFKVNEVLISKKNDSINRVFTIDFPSKEIMDQFFTDPQYLAVKAKYFDSAVRTVTIISMHEKQT